MENQFILLYYLSSVTGLIMVVGGIFLLYKEKIYIDSQTKEVTALETPVGTFRTNAPALALFLIGFIPLIYPIYQSSKKEDTVTLYGKLIEDNSIYPVQAYVVLDSQSFNNKSDYIFNVPAHWDKGYYKVLYKMKGDNVQEETANLASAQNGQITLVGIQKKKTDADGIMAVPQGF